MGERDNNNQQWWENYNELQRRLSIRRTIMRFVVRERRTLKVALTYIPYVLAMTSEGLIQLGTQTDTTIEISPV